MTVGGNLVTPTDATNIAELLASGNCIAGAVYGGGQDGHVINDSKVTMTGGLVGHSMYGAGSGKGKFAKWLDMIPSSRVDVKVDNSTTPAATPPSKDGNTYLDNIYSITAGRVFGNSEVMMSGGYVVRNIYGGGNLGSVGKGNYSGGKDDYSQAGYGETLTDNLWDGQEHDGHHFSAAFLNSGKSKVTITGGKVGYIDFNNVSDYTYSNLPYGNVFGGCRGEAAPNILESPRYEYSPAFFSGYVNETEVIIGEESSSTGPTIAGSVYGGGMDGHVRRDAKVTINSGEIGRAYTGDGSAADLEKVPVNQILQDICIGKLIHDRLCRAPQERRKVSHRQCFMPLFPNQPEGTIYHGFFCSG